MVVVTAPSSWGEDFLIWLLLSPFKSWLILNLNRTELQIKRSYWTVMLGRELYRQTGTAVKMHHCPVTMNNENCILFSAAGCINGHLLKVRKLDWWMYFSKQKEKYESWALPECFWWPVSSQMAPDSVLGRWSSWSMSIRQRLSTDKAINLHTPFNPVSLTKAIVLAYVPSILIHSLSQKALRLGITWTVHLTPDFGHCVQHVELRSRRRIGLQVLCCFINDIHYCFARNICFLEGHGKTKNKKNVSKNRQGH